MSVCHFCSGLLNDQIDRKVENLIQIFIYTVPLQSFEAEIVELF